MSTKGPTSRRSQMSFRGLLRPLGVASTALPDGRSLCDSSLLRWGAAITFRSCAQPPTPPWCPHRLSAFAFFCCNVNLNEPKFRRQRGRSDVPPTTSEVLAPT